VENFKVLALGYLNDWIKHDKRFVKDLCSEDRSIRLRGMLEAAKNYRVIRNFKRRPDEGTNRLAKALQALDDVCDSVTEKNVDSIVNKLAGKFESDYGRTAVSAASKFLWFRHRSPVVIYDSRALKCLKKLSHGRLSEHSYDEYRREWLVQFAACEESIRSACDDLVRVKDFSLAQDETDEYVGTLARNDWFHERVFDKFLWRDGGD
jgi:hypothetical protein